MSDSFKSVIKSQCFVTFTDYFKVRIALSFYQIVDWQGYIHFVIVLYIKVTIRGTSNLAFIYLCSLCPFPEKF